MALRQEDEIDRLLADLRAVTAEIGDERGNLDALLGRQTDLFAALRSVGATNERIAEAAGVSDVAVTQRLRRARERSES